MAGSGYFLFSLLFFFWLAPLETTVAGVKISIVSLEVPVKVALGMLLVGCYLRHNEAPWFEPALVVSGLTGFFFLLPHSLGGDGVDRFRALAHLLEAGQLPYMSYSLVGPLFSSPLYWLGKVVQTPEWWCSRFNVVLLALGFLALYRLMASTEDKPRLLAFFLILLTGSMFPHHLWFYFGEVFTAVWVAVGTAAWVTGRPRLGWTALIIGVLNTPAALPALGLLALQRCFQKKSPAALLPWLLAISLFLLENAVRRGDFFATGYGNNAGIPTVLPYSGRSGFSYPFLLGLFSIFFSSGKGLLLFAPGMFLRLKQGWSRMGEPWLQIHRLWILFVAGLVLVYAKWWCWYGGYFWGPRFFLFASLPASLVLALRLRSDESPLAANLITLSVLSLSFWMGLNGAVFGQRGLEICLQDRQALEFLCWYVPEFSVLWRPLMDSGRLNWQQEALIAYFLLVWVHLSRRLLVQVIRQGTQRIRHRL